MLMADDATERKISHAYKVACNKLTPSDLGKLKFLLSDKLNVNALLNAKEASDVFQLCESQHRTLDFLSGLLQLLQRHDILSQFDSTRLTTLSHSSSMPSSKHNLVQSPLISNRRLFLYRLVDEKQLHTRNLSCLVLFHGLNSDFADREWPYVIEELLHTKLLHEDADEAAVRDWIRSYIDVAIAEYTDADQQFGQPRVLCQHQAEHVDQVDTAQVPAELPSPNECYGSIDWVNEQEMKESYYDINKLGESQSAVVYSGVCPKRLMGKFGQLKAAVKVFRIKGQIHENLKKQFVQELLATHALRSPYLLPLLCFCSPSERVTGEPYYALMFPLMSRGDMYNRLFGKKPQSELSWRSRVRIAYQIAAGLQAMHSLVPRHRQPILHRDIKSGNILLDECDNARLADTGLSRELLQGTLSCHTMYCGTPGYSHPDAILGRYYLHYDWFSFGIVLLELVLEKPAQSGEALQLKLKDPQSKWKYTDHRLDQPPDVRNELSKCWTTCEESENAAYRLLYVALHCISSTGNAFDDIHSKEFLGLEYLCWKELTPVTLLRNLCTMNGIRLHEFATGVPAMSENANFKRCASCFIYIKEDADGLHTRSEHCRYDECLWYCSSCMRSKEPVVCLTHGTAQPILGGANAYVIEVSGDGAGAAVFQQDCESLKEIMVDYRFAGLSDANVFVIPKPDESAVRLTLLQIIFLLETECINNSCSLVLRDLRLDERHRELVLEAVIEVCACLRKQHARQECSKSDIFLKIGNDQSLLKFKNSLVTKLVDLAWNRALSFGLDLKQRASQTLAMLDLWKGNNPVDSVRREREREAKELESLASKYSEKCTDLRILVDKCFAELISISLPARAHALSDADLLRCTARLGRILDEKTLSLAGEKILSSLQPLSDGLIWYHYCGHAPEIDDAPLDDRLLPSTLLQVAGRLVASLVVSLDCCYADNKKPKIHFNLNEHVHYSSFTVLTSCTAGEKSSFSNSTAFTGFLLCGLLGAFGDCRSTFDLCFLGDTCDESACCACKSYKEKSKQCTMCSKYRSTSSGTRTLTDVFEYAKAHICTSRMHPVSTGSAVTGVPPVVYSHPEAPTYNVRVDLPEDGQPYLRDHFTFKFKQLPRQLSQVRLALLYEMLLQRLKRDTGSTDKLTRSAAACLLVDCDGQSCITRKCIDLALKLIEARIGKKAPQSVASVSASNAQEFPSMNYSTSICQAADNGDASESSIEAVASEDCAATAESFAKVFSRMSFYTVVGKILSDSDLQMYFRRGFDVLCIMDIS